MITTYHRVSFNAGRTLKVLVLPLGDRGRAPLPLDTAFGLLGMLGWRQVFSKRTDCPE